MSETAKRASDDAHNAGGHREAARLHDQTARAHKSGTGGGEVAWLHELAASNHRQAASWRDAEARVDPSKVTRTRKSLAAYQEKIAAASEHGSMAQEYARQAIVAAKKRV